MLRRRGLLLLVPALALSACADDPPTEGQASTTVPTIAPTTSAPSATTTTTTVPPAAEHSVELIVGDPLLEVERVPGMESSVNVPVYLASRGAALEFIVTRPDYGRAGEVAARVVPDTGARPLPTPKGAEVDWAGFSGFAEMVVRAADGTVVANDEVDFCPNGQAQRIDATGPDLSPYPFDCLGQLLSLGSVWGIAQGWAGLMSGYRDLPLPADLPAGDYSVQVSVAEPYDTWLGGLDPVSVDLRVTDIEPDGALDMGDDDGDGLPNWQDPVYNSDEDDDGIDDSGDPLIDRDRDGIDDFLDAELDLDGDGLHDVFGTPNGTLPYDTDGTDPQVVDATEPAHDHSGRPAGSDARPDRSTVPDLRALPAFQISTSVEGELDLLNFSSVTWNAGPAPLVIDGFRNDDDPDLMDAHQTFYADGEAVGSAPIGTLEYHRGGGHDHWHFLDFSRYELVAASGESQLSGKQSWCLANNYPVDLTLPGVVWSTQLDSLATSCGGEAALWVRQVLAVGWGDLYVQAVSGQSFDITDLPNGVYTIRITANPDGDIYEASTRNNVSERIVRLGGVPGARTVSVPPFRGLDTEAPIEFGLGPMPPGASVEFGKLSPGA